ncbi:MAG: DUF4129 domain-containing protein [Oscillochloris sp.]|nr:DUF4129 domain-containing protein [Oscillochloris sp.]
MARLIRILALAGMEAVIVGLPLLALTGNDPGLHWLIGLILAGRLVDIIALRAPRVAERPILLIGALGTMILGISFALGLNIVGAIAILMPGSEQFGSAYLVGLVSLYLFWRGTRIAVADSNMVTSLFGRGAAVLLLALLLRPVFRPGAELPTITLAVHILLFVGLSLFGLALAHTDDEGVGTRRLSWRWILTLILAIGGVILVGALGTALLGGDEALQIAQNLIQLALIPFAIVGGFIAWIFITLFAEPLSALIRALMGAFPQLQPAVDQSAEDASEVLDLAPSDFIITLANSFTWLMALIPIVILVIAILIMRRRFQPRPEGEEDRESLGVAAGLAADLRDLLGRLRNPFAQRLQGLEAALAALRGPDPTSRVRRAYVKLLLALEDRGRSRSATMTPAEFAPLAGETLGAPHEVAVLTEAYERARYQPAGASSADAEAAEAALQAMGSQVKGIS